MTSDEKDCDQKNNDIWSEDRLNRGAEAKKLTEYLLNRFTVKKDSFVLNLDAEWGFGKTFFLQNWKKHLEIDKECQVVYFNAWKSDFADKPLISFIAAVENQLSEFIKKDKNVGNFWNKVKTKSLPILLSFGAKKLTGWTLEELSEISNSLESISSDDVQEDTSSDSDHENNSNDNNGLEQLAGSLTTQLVEIAIKEQKQVENSIDTFINSLQSIAAIAGEGKKPLFIFVDELDRCRPNYAIELLEIIKHLFSANGVYFVIATASEQLSESIKCIYGNNFDARRYLQRFFHQEYRFKEPSIGEFIASLWSSEISETPQFRSFIGSIKEQDDNNIDILTNIAVAYKAGLRDVERAITIFDGIRIVNPEKQFCTLALALLVFAKVCDDETYERLSKCFLSESQLKFESEFESKMLNRVNNKEQKEKIRLLLREFASILSIVRGTTKKVDAKYAIHTEFFNWFFSGGNEKVEIAEYPSVVDSAGSYLLKL